MSARAPSWSCPLCGDVPSDPRNEQYEWCERCLGYTANPITNEAFAWKQYVGGDLDGAWRLYELRLMIVGDEQMPEGSGDVYGWDGTQWNYLRTPEGV